jgi:hypothetical protein
VQRFQEWWVQITENGKKRFPKWAIGVIVVLAVVLVGTLLDSDEENAQPTPSQVTTSSPTQSEAAKSEVEDTTAEPVETDATASNGTCQEISARLLEAINSGIQDIQASNSVLRAAAYKAPDRANVWFVAAEIRGPGIGAGEAVGVWASSYGVEDDGSGSLFSVDGIANGFSSWGSTEGTTFEISRFEDGVQESRDCLN